MLPKQLQYTNFSAPAGSNQIYSQSPHYQNDDHVLCSTIPQTTLASSSIKSPNVSLASLYMHAAQLTHKKPYSKIADINNRRVTQNIWYQTHFKPIRYKLDTDKSHSGAPPGDQSGPQHPESVTTTVYTNIQHENSMLP